MSVCNWRALRPFSGKSSPTEVWAAQYMGPNHIQLVAKPLQKAGHHEALIRVEACGICGSDLSILAGKHPRAKPPLTIGHEFCGHVMSINGDGNGIQVGDRVVVFPLISCGQCHACSTGNSHVCRTLRLYGIDVDGGMSEVARVATANLLPIPAALPVAVAAALEPLAVGVHAVSRAPVNPEDTAVVLGAGPVGLVTALVLLHRGVRTLFITDMDPFRMELAQRLGLHAVPVNKIASVIREATSEDGADVLFECTGDAGAALEMTDWVRSRGWIVNVGVFKTPPAVDMRAVNFKELTIVGSRVYTRADFQKAIEIAPDLPLADVVTHRFPLQDIHSALASIAARDRVSKVLMEPKGSL